MTHDLEGVGNDADSHELLSVVAAVHHEGVGQALDDGALSLAETLGSIAASGVRKVDRGADLDVVAIKGEAESANLVSVPIRKFFSIVIPFADIPFCRAFSSVHVESIVSQQILAFSTGRHKTHARITIKIAMNWGAPTSRRCP